MDTDLGIAFIGAAAFVAIFLSSVAVIRVCVSVRSKCKQSRNSTGESADTFITTCLFYMYA